MSRSGLAVFVEGFEDLYFFGRVAETAGFPDARLAFAGELPGGVPGKRGLEEFYAYLRTRGLLDGVFKGKRTVCVFYVDKDLDDFLRRKRRSRHFVYTSSYDLDGLLFQHGPVAEALSAASNLPLADTRAAFVGRVWACEQARKWREWIDLCFFVRLERIDVGATYSRVSQIHDNAGRLDIAAEADFWRRVEADMGLAPEAFAARRAQRRTTVDRVFAEGAHERVFRGKWCRRLIEVEAGQIAAGRAYSGQGLGDRVVALLAALVDLTDGWADHLLEPIRELTI